MQIVRTHGATHVRRGGGDDGIGFRDVLLRRGPMREIRENRTPRFATGFDNKPMVFVSAEFRQSKIIDPRRLWPRLHGDAKTGGTGNRTIDGDDEKGFAPCPVMPVNLRAMCQDAVLNGDGMQIAPPHADESESLIRERRGGNAQSLLGTLGRPEKLGWRVEKFLPGMRAHSIAENGIVVAWNQPVMPAVLFIGPTARQLRKR